MEPGPSVPNDPHARPSLDAVLELRAERMAIMRAAIAGLTDDVLSGETDAIHGPGYPAAGEYPVARCRCAVINEEWLHRLYAERDLPCTRRAVPEMSAGRADPSASDAVSRSRMLLAPLLCLAGKILRLSAR